MVKTVELQTIVERCSLAQFWNIVYEQPSCMVAFHRAINGCDAVVTPWSDGLRTVSFSMAMNVPDFVKRMLSVDAIKVEETQVVLWTTTQSFTISSSTKVQNVSAAQRFTTKLRLTASSRPPSSSTGNLGEAVDLHFSVEVAAGVVWPLSSSIENVMAEQATQSMTKFVDFAVKAVEEALATPTPPPSPPPATFTPQEEVDEGTRRATSILPSPTLSRTGSVRRWPTAIVSRSSSFPSGPLPLAGDEVHVEQSFQDASEAFSTPGNSINRNRFAVLAPSDALITPLLEENEGRDIEEGRPLQEERGFEIRGRKEREREDDMKILAAALRSLSSEVKEMRRVVESIHHSGLPHGELTGGSSISASRIVIIVISLLIGLWFLRLILFQYRTGLIFPPPSPPTDSFHATIRM